MGNMFGSTGLLAALILSSFCASAFDFQKETLLRSWNEHFHKLSSEEQIVLSAQIRSSVSDLTADDRELNLLGVLAFSEGDHARALTIFQRASELSNYTDGDVVRNWLDAQHAVGGFSPITVLSDLIPKYPESRVLPQELANEFTLYSLDETYDHIFAVLKRFPTTYGLWVLFAEMHLRHNFIGGGRAPNAGIEFTEEAAMIQYGLTIFPRCPELLLLRTIHAITYGHTLCAAYYSDMTTKHRHLNYNVIHQNHFETIARAVAASATDVDLDYARHSCMPNVEHHSRASYQATYSMIQHTTGADWTPVLNISSAAPHTVNELAPSSIRAVPAQDGQEDLVHLPSLQVGCSRPELCALPGFLVADAVAAASTHFVTEAYDLRMVEDASVGLVYSSHTLEHLSHNLPPASCPSHPRPDASVRGCDSEVGASLTEWRRVLAPGGRLLVSVPDVAVLATALIHPEATAEHKWNWMRYMFGGQSDRYDFHKTGFYYELLEELLLSRGFCNVTRVRRFSIFADASWNTDFLSLSVHAVAC